MNNVFLEKSNECWNIQIYYLKKMAIFEPRIKCLTHYFELNYISVFLIYMNNVFWFKKNQRVQKYTNLLLKNDGYCEYLWFCQVL
jgi:hypothetical protein